MAKAIQALHETTSTVRQAISFLRQRAGCLTGSDSDAWDLVQDALERAVHQWPKPWAGADLQRWLTVVLRNLNIDRLRSASRRASLTRDGTALDLLRAPDPVEVPSWRIVDPEQVAAGLARLPEQHRRILLMRVDGKSLREIGLATGTNPATVGTQIFRAKKQIARHPRPTIHHALAYARTRSRRSATSPPLPGRAGSRRPCRFAWRRRTDGSRCWRRSRARSAAGASASSIGGLEDELRARGMLGRMLQAGTMRLLAADRLQTARVELNARAVEHWIDSFRRERGLLSGESFEAWLGDSGLSDAELEGFFRRQAVVCATLSELRSSIGAAVEDELRVAGQLHEMRSAVARKEAAFTRRGLGTPTLEDAGLSETELWQRFFRDRLRMPVPESISVYAAAEGSTVDDLRLAALREAVFRRLSESADIDALNPMIHGTTT